MRRAGGLLMLLLAAATVRAQQPAAKIESLAWMAGGWIERKESGVTEKQWLAPQGGLMLGVNRAVASKGKTSYEFLRIQETAGGISYFASPQGSAATEFKLKELAGKRVVFENAAHYFPQRISYRLADDGRLRAGIEGTIGGQERAMEWRWEKQK